MEASARVAAAASADFPLRHRIVFVTRSLGMGGTEKHLADLIERLDPSRFELMVVAMGQQPFAARQDGKLPAARVLPGPGTGRLSTSLPFLRSLKPAVVVFIDNEFGAFHWQMYLAARFSGARRVVTIEHQPARAPQETNLVRVLRGRTDKVRAVGGWLAALLRRAVTARAPGVISDETICVCDAVRDRLVEDYRYPAGKTITVRNGVDVKRFSRDAGDWGIPAILSARKPRGPIAVFVSRLVLEKRVDLLIRAMKRLVAAHPSSSCVIVGGGPMEAELRSMVDAMSLQDHVLFAGDTSDVRPYLAAGDIFVLPSEREGLSLSLLEAMAFGLPCIAADAGGSREAIEEGVNGFVIPCDSEESLVAALSRLFANPAERTQMGKSSRRIAEEKFDLERSMQRIRSEIVRGLPPVEPR